RGASVPCGAPRARLAIVAARGEVRAGVARAAIAASAVAVAEGATARGRADTVLASLARQAVAWLRAPARAVAEAERAVRASANGGAGAAVAASGVADSG